MLPGGGSGPDVAEMHLERLQPCKSSSILPFFPLQ
jgi:hypothetical protein